MKEEKKKENI